MPNINDPADVPLPAFLDPLLAYLASVLPADVYAILLNLSAHALSLLTSLLHLASAITWNPADWDAHKIIPPLITLLAAYLALLSAYRTTTWIFRTTFFFLKWGAILGALFGGAGWFMGAQAGAGGVVPALTGLLLDLVNGRAQDAAGGTRPQGRPRPKAWEPFDRHREWQHEHEETQRGTDHSAAEEVQRFVADVMGRAREGGWWEAVRGAAAGLAQGEAGEQDEAASARRKQPSRKAKSKTKQSRSR
ncbi:hypothetical protein FA95DRAFT_1597463 [Auriscalpium vulgare]|uniref:Uncharacterized protein n=1 Tax=Auriscalpium vulgare TaxID=40419 RepID=A0ACB8RLG2_9AGAM|nr:hypothetical protein FA95DRAFT_1597463 [Auriscalpium vulgare]